MKYIVTLNGKKYEVEVEKGQAEAVYLGPADAVASAAPAAVAAAPAAPAQEKPAAEEPAAEAGEGDPIKAPMPGTILDIRVSAGKTVKKGDIMFILEAMKMENEIVAPKDGTVTSVIINKGAAVKTDQTLATLK